VSDLRTLVVRKGGLRRRIALLADDASIVRGLEQNGCTVLADPEPDELRGFQPHAVIAFDGALEGDLFGLLADAAPKAEVIFSCANAGGASVLVRQLLGLEAPKGQALGPLEKRLAEAGYQLVSREPVVVPFKKSGLSADAEAALRAFFEQVNPAAAADRWLYVAKRGPAQAASPPEEQYAIFGEGDPSRLIEALKNDTAAWAVAGEAASVRQALLTGACSTFVVDRERVGPFPLVLLKDAPAPEAVLFARLAAVFPPLFVGGPPLPRVAPITEALDAMKARPLRMLTTLESFLGDAAPLRHQLADRVDAQLKKRTPNLHRALRGLFEKD
jgi:hypothetical protein